MREEIERGALSFCRNVYLQLCMCVCAGEKYDLASSLEPECVMELLRQWALATESIIPLSFAECLIFAYVQLFILSLSLSHAQCPYCPFH